MTTYLNGRYLVKVESYRVFEESGVAIAPTQVFLLEIANKNRFTSLKPDF
ncbi:MAG: hypothetical protein HC899_32030 [Leptolyngbyaceae cyanobacterium SM1_4_3]|nr:hypothetical protein [Leptolyngbyaceae cyanobacterium SM1_4_3]